MLCRCASLELFWSRVCSGRPSSSTSALVVFLFRLISGWASDHSTSWNCRETMRNCCFLDNIRCCNDLVQSISAKATRKFWAVRLRRGIQVENQRYGGLGETLCEVVGLPNEDPWSLERILHASVNLHNLFREIVLMSILILEQPEWPPKALENMYMNHWNEMGIVMSCKALNIFEHHVKM